MLGTFLIDRARLHPPGRFPQGRGFVAITTAKDPPPPRRGRVGVGAFGRWSASACKTWSVRYSYGSKSMNRRDFIALVASTALGAPRPAKAQATKRIVRIGFLPA